MEISTKATYILPVILLLAASLFFNNCLVDDTIATITFSPNIIVAILISLLPLVWAFLFYLLFKKVSTKFNTQYLKYLLFILPAFIQFVYELLINAPIKFDAVCFLSGLLLFLAFQSFTKRYMAVLTETSIEFKNLLGQKGFIPLASLTILEQKRNILTFLKEFTFLKMTKKTGITFVDENLDEFEINIYPILFNNGEVFEKIITNANNCGNLKVRQYTM